MSLSKTLEEAVEICHQSKTHLNLPKEIHGFLDNWLNQVFSANIEKIKADEVMAQPALGVTWDILRFLHLPNGTPDHLSYLIYAVA